MIRLY